VIEGRCKDVPEDEAMDHVAGYTLLNDLSARGGVVSTGTPGGRGQPAGPQRVAQARRRGRDQLAAAG
jgi:2-keto-4-pentenoate hydratase/2-oxohepta-3-ene-1,7-dioic acid hydratase in catechol pathway